MNHLSLALCLLIFAQSVGARGRATRIGSDVSPDYSASMKLADSFPTLVQDDDPFLKKALKQQPLFDAIEAGDKQKVLKLLRRANHPNLNHRELWLGDTFLIEAIRAKQAEIVSILLAKGADPNLREVTGEDENGKWLLGSSPLECAVEQGSEEIVRLLVRRGVRLKADPDILHAANSIGMIRLLLENGAPINGRDSHGDTYLHKAAPEPELQEIAKLLVERGAKVAVVDDSGRTPLHLVATVGLAEILLKKGAQVDVADNYGLTPLHLASWSNRIDLVGLLLASGADIDARDKFGYSALDWLVVDWYSHNQELALLLVSHGAKINESLVRQYGLVEVFEQIKKQIK